MSQKTTRGGAERPSAGSAVRALGSPELPPGRRPNPSLPLLGLARAALGVATVIALYLTYASLSGGGVAGCGPEGGCGEVLSSRWSKWVGVPVSLPAAGLYLALLALSLKLPRRPAGDPEGGCEAAIRIGSWSVMGAAVWFLGLSATVLGRFCPYCFAVHLTGSLGAVLLLKSLQTAGTGKSPGGVVRKFSWLAQAQWAALLLGVLIAGQLLYVPQTYRVTSTPPPSTSPSTISPSPVPKAAVPPPTPTPTVAAAPAAPVPASVASPTPAPSLAPAQSPKPAAAVVAMGLLSLHDARFRLDPATLPILGKASAPYLMVSQFDYTCEHCRRTHGPIRQVQAYFSNELAVICLPMPLDGRCNEWVKRTSSLHAQACQLAALSLGVWRAAPDKYHEFDDLLMTEPEALNIKVAFERAQKLVGAQALESAITDQWVPETLQLSVSLYRSNWLASRSGSMPMMNIGTNIVSGTVGSAGELFRLVDLGLGLKRRP